MQAIEFPSVSARHVNHLVDLQASAAAVAALRAAASRAPQSAVLTTAVSFLANQTEDGAFDAFRNAVLSSAFRSALPGWIRELREVAAAWPDSGACTVATALRLSSWTLDFLVPTENTAIDELVEIVAALVAARCLVLDAVTSRSELRQDIAHVYAAKTASCAGTVCAQLVFGYRSHRTWNAEGCATCYVTDDLDDLEAVMPGFTAAGLATIDVIEADGTHPAKRGPCANFEGLDTFMSLRNRLDACLTGARIAKDRAATAIAGRS